MNQSRRVSIHRLPTGVAGLDAVLGGGLPEYSFNLVAGGPGAGKTTLVQQIMFANATIERPALYFTVLGEPPLKMLRYQQQFSFFDIDKVDGIVRFSNLSQVLLQHGLGQALESLMREVEGANPGIVVVDSFQTLVRGSASSERELQEFLQRLALFLGGWQATSFLAGEYVENEVRDNPVFTVADGILWLYQSVERNSIVRKLQVMKLRGQSTTPGLHTFRITDDGIHVFPRVHRRPGQERTARPARRVSAGVTGLDEMLGGGIQVGDAVLVAGPAGSGKTVLGVQFIAEGLRQNEPGVIAVFEEHPEEYLERAQGLGVDLQEMIRKGALEVIYLHPLDLSVDETLLEIREAVERIGATRLVIDSISGFELSLATSFREDFRESLYRMVGSLTGMGITVLLTVELVESYQELRFSPHVISFLTDDIILQRYVEMEGQLRRAIMVVKMRGSQHSKDMRAYEITSQGLVVGEALSEYRGILTGVPEPRVRARSVTYPGLTEWETSILQTVVALRRATTEELRRQTGLAEAALTTALDRLVALDYAIRVNEEGQTFYRPLAHPVS